MAIAQRTGFETKTARSEVKDYDTSIILGVVAFGIVVLIAIYLGFVSGGTPGDFAAMTVYP
jgi:hypothetical protein